jgi:EEF1A N-terminal glycine/lysine methyltransferase
MDIDEPEDILNDSLVFLGGNPVVDSDTVSYGPLTLTIAPKVLLFQLGSVIY